MKVIGFNGSPRKNCNTAKLLSKALEGAASNGAETELIHLYDLNYKGCTSCFSCKLKNGKSYGRCAYKDDLTPILEKVSNAGAIILGSPIYFRDVSGEMRSFMERLMFPYVAYMKPPQTLFSGKIKVGCIYTMNIASVEEASEKGLSQYLNMQEATLKMLFGSVDTLSSYDTYQFKNYSKFVAEMFDPEQKARKRKEVFPEDSRRAYAMGVGLTQ